MDQTKSRFFKCKRTQWIYEDRRALNYYDMLGMVEFRAYDSYRIIYLNLSCRYVNYGHQQLTRVFYAALRFANICLHISWGRNWSLTYLESEEISRSFAICCWLLESALGLFHLHGKSANCRVLHKHSSPFKLDRSCSCFLCILPHTRWKQVSSLRSYARAC